MAKRRKSPIIGKEGQDPQPLYHTLIRARDALVGVKEGLNWLRYYCQHEPFVDPRQIANAVNVSARSLRQAQRVLNDYLRETKEKAIS